MYKKGLMDMMNLSDHYQYLFLGKVTGTLSSSEAAELDMLLGNNADIKTAYEEFTRQLPSKYVSSSFDHLNDPGYWKDIAGQYEKKRTIPAWLRLGVAAAIIALVAVGWYMLRPEGNKAIARRGPEKKKEFVQLKLSGGRSIDLSNTRGQINEGSTEVVNHDESLSYSSKNAADHGINEVSIPIGMDYQVTLSDGSKVWMNSKSHLFFPTNFNADNREISIDGEAYIEVAQDAARPFIVKLPNAVVHVLGTAFNINTYDPGVTKVALVNGSIQFAGAETNLVVKPGEQIVYTADGAVSRQSFDPKFVLSWKKGLFYFEEADLSEIAMVIQRWFGTSTIIDDKKLLSTKVAGVLNKSQPLENFLDDLKAIANIQSYFDKDGVLHFK
jgi:transmembrane sensor